MEKITEDACDDEYCEGSDRAIALRVSQNMLAEETAVELADVFKALSDPTRIKLIFALLQSELCVHDLQVILEMGQSAVSHQLRYLRNMRIVKRRKVGKIVFYSLDDDHVEQLVQLTLQHIKHR